MSDSIVIDLIAQKSESEEHHWIAYWNFDARPVMIKLFWDISDADGLMWARHVHRLSGRLDRWAMGFDQWTVEVSDTFRRKFIFPILELNHLLSSYRSLSETNLSQSTETQPQSISLPVRLILPTHRSSLSLKYSITHYDVFTISWLGLGLEFPTIQCFFRNHDAPRLQIVVTIQSTNSKLKRCLVKILEHEAYLSIILQVSKHVHRSFY